MKLNDRDVLWICRRLPKAIEQFLYENDEDPIILGGGFIRACIAGETPNDIDFFVPSTEAAESLADSFLDLAKAEDPHRAHLVRTENAFTVLGFSLPLQIIHRWTFPDAFKLIESFDFTIARAAIWHSKTGWSSVRDDAFYEDLAAKRLVYRSPVREEEPGGSMIRVLKFYERGYRIPLDSLGAVIARLVSKVEKRDDYPDDEAAREKWTADVVAGLLYEVDPLITDKERFSKKGDRP